MVFWILFWLIPVAIFVLLIYAGAHVELAKWVNSFYKKLNVDEKVDDKNDV